MTFNRRDILALAGTAAAAPLFSVRPAFSADFVNVLTGGTAGIYYPLGVAISAIVVETVPGTRPTVQATKGSVENLNLLDAGKGEVAFALGDAVIEALAGNADVGFKKKLENIRTLGAIYNNYVQIVALADSGVTAITDLKGKRLSVGAPKSGTELNARAVLKAAGLSYDDLAKVEYLDFAQSVELMKNRQLDATLQSAGLGVASLRDLSVSVPVTIVSVDPAIVGSMGTPYLPGTIPAKTYEGQTADVPTVAIPNYLMTRADLSDDLVYGITKAIYSNLDKLVAAHAAAKKIDPAAAAKNPIAPMHPGSAKYFAEVAG